MTPTETLTREKSARTPATGRPATPPRKAAGTSASDGTDSTTAPASNRRGGRRLAALLVLLAGINLAGLPYYLAPIGERLRSPLHPWFKPSGYVGQTAGIIAFALFVFLWLYPLRKRFPRLLGFTGTIVGWLDLHILAGLAIPVLGAVHASWRFKGLIGLGYLAMVLVAASGVVGRYLYTRIPRRRNGLELTAAEIEGRREVLAHEIVARTSLDLAQVEAALRTPDTSARTGLLSAFIRLLTSDLVRWRAGRRAAARLTRAAGGRKALDGATRREAMRLIRQRLKLTHQIGMLDATHRLFRFWHVAHRPFAVSALIAVTVHVAVVVALGVTWLW